jgi:hypothetical protein
LDFLRYTDQPTVSNHSVFTPNFHKPEATWCLGILEDIEEKTFRLRSASSPHGTMGRLEGFYVFRSDLKSYEKGELFFRRGHNRRYPSKIEFER